MRLFALLFCIGTAMIGYQIHHSFFWSVVDFLFSPVAWCKWLLCQEVTLSVIKAAFPWFFK